MAENSQVTVTGGMSVVAGCENAQVSATLRGTQLETVRPPGISPPGGRRPQPIEAEVSTFNASLPQPEGSSPSARRSPTRGSEVTRTGEVAQPWEDCPRCGVTGIRVQTETVIYCADCGLREDPETGGMLVPWQPADEAAFTRDLKLVVDTADEWAGEYGFSPSAREQANAVLDAVARLRTDYLGECQRCGDPTDLPLCGTCEERVHHEGSAAGR